MNKLALTSTALWAATAAACFGTKTFEPAPLSGGEKLTYQIDVGTGITNGIFTFDKRDSGFVLQSNSPTNPTQTLGPDLRDGRTPIKAFDFGMIWLPPSLRTVGSRTLLGTVVRTEQKEGRSLVVVSERNGAVMRLFDQNTGFLVQLQRNGGTGLSRMAQLVSSTIPGL